MNYDLLKTLLRKHEGYSEKPYKCSAGKLTIGIGHNIEDRGLHPDVIEHQFQLDIQESVEICQELFKNWQLIPPNKQAVLVDMAFNLGELRLKGFKKMIIAVSWGDWEKAAHEMLCSKWADQVGHRAVELSNIMKEKDCQ